MHLVASYIALGHIQMNTIPGICSRSKLSGKPQHMQFFCCLFVHNGPPRCLCVPESVSVSSWALNRLFSFTHNNVSGIFHSIALHTCVCEQRMTALRNIYIDTMCALYVQIPYKIQCMHSICTNIIQYNVCTLYVQILYNTMCALYMYK